MVRRMSRPLRSARALLRGAAAVRTAVVVLAIAWAGTFAGVRGVSASCPASATLTAIAAITSAAAASAISGARDAHPALKRAPAHVDKVVAHASHAVAHAALPASAQGAPLVPPAVLVGQVAFVADLPVSADSVFDSPRSRGPPSRLS